MGKGIKNQQCLRGNQIHKEGDCWLERGRDESRKQQQRKISSYFQKNNEV